MKKRKIAFITGSRSEYDVVYSSMKAIRDSEKLELQVVVTGTHLADRFGQTYREIEKDGFRIAQKVISLLGTDTLLGRTKSIGIQIMGLAEAFDRLKPDVVLVSGDREDTLSAATAANYLNIPVAHMYGGDTAYGSVDNLVRDAVSKLSHFHFAMTEKHAQKIVSMGEDSKRVFTVGHGGLDRILQTPKLSRTELSKALKFDLTRGPITLVIQHVLSSEISNAEFQIATTLEAAFRGPGKVVIGYPNSDVGSNAIIQTIEKFRAHHADRCYVYKNLSRLFFVNLLRFADVLVGNSSCGIFEAPLLKLPVVNTGNRQRNRVHANNVVFVPHDVVAIRKAILQMTTDKRKIALVKRCANLFGNGHTGEKIVSILEKTKINKDILCKH